MHCIRESHKIRTLLSETGSSFSPVSRAKSTRHLKKDERQEILFSTAMPLRSHGMSPKTVPLRSTPLTQAISDRSAIPRITSSFSRGFRSKVKTSISLPDAILSLHPFPWPKKDLVTLWASDRIRLPISAPEIALSSWRQETRTTLPTMTIFPSRFPRMPRPQCRQDK